MNKEELFDCLKDLSKTNNLRDGIDIRKEEANIIVNEIERLNNIIKKLNCGIKELDNMFYETFRISQNSYYSISEWELKEFTDKLKDLEEVNKE